MSHLIFSFSPCHQTPSDSVSPHLPSSCNSSSQACNTSLSDGNTPNLPDISAVHLKQIGRVHLLLLLNTPCLKKATCVFINIHSVSTATLLRLVPTAVHVALRFFWCNFLRSVVSTEAFLRELNPGIPVVLLKTSLFALFYCVCGGKVCFIGKISQTSFIIHKTLAIN